MHERDIKSRPQGLGLAALGVLLCQCSAWAADAPATDAADAPTATPGLQTVVVTAERRTQDLQKTAVSITSLNGDELAQKGKSDVADILQDVAGVVFQNANPSGAPLVSIRGIGTDSPNAPAGTAMYVDGLIMNQSAFQFYDLERVEVLRGPQGTLYGRGAPAGTVNFITRDPGKRFDAGFTTEIGSYRLLHETGFINVPLGDTLSARLAFNAVKRDGYYSNGLSNDDERNVRLKLKYEPASALSILLGAEYYKGNSTGEGATALDANDEVPALTSTAPAGVARSNNTYKRLFTKLDWDLGAVRLTYLPGYQDFTQDVTQFVNGNLNGVAGPRDAVTTQELRLTGTASGPLTWVAGLYQARRDLVNDTSVAFNSNYPAEYFLVVRDAQVTRSRAAFGEATYAFMPDLRLTLGARITRDSFRDHQVNDFTDLAPPVLTDSTVDLDGRYKRVDHKIRLEKDLGRDSLVYLANTTGYRPGGPAVSGTSYGPEVNKAWELGSKNRLLGGRLQVNGALFHYDYPGFQTPTPLWLNNDSSTGVVIGTQVVNAPAKFTGGELETQWQASLRDVLGLSVSLLDAKYADGNPVTHSPKATVSGSFEHVFGLASGGSVRAGADLRYQSGQYTNYNQVPDPATLQKAYVLGNLRLGWESADGRFSANAYVKNVGNEHAKLQVTSGYALVDAPRTVGVVFGVGL